jgi:hypothetical protein
VVCFKNRIGQPLKTKSLPKSADGAAIATLKSRLKMKPINHRFDHGFPPKNIEQS